MRDSSPQAPQESDAADENDEKMLLLENMLNNTFGGYALKTLDIADVRLTVFDLPMTLPEIHEACQTSLMSKLPTY